MKIDTQTEDLEDLEFVRSCVLELLYASLARSPESRDIIAMIEIVQSGRFEGADGALKSTKH